MKADRRSGFTIVEMAIAGVVLAILGAALVTTLEELRDATLSQSVQAKLQEAGERAMLQILRDLRRSGQVSVGGVDFPHMIDDGNALGIWAGHWHPPAVEHAPPGDPANGVNRDIVFLLFQDQDTIGPPFMAGVSDGMPDLDPDGNLIWGATEFSYVLVTGADGISRLERRTNAANPRTVASFVERLVFDDMTTDVTVPVDCVRIQILLRQVDSEGVVHRYQTQATVRMRNGIDA